MAIGEPEGNAGMCVEVVYAEPGKQVLRQIQVAPGTTAREAVRIAQLQKEFPEFRLGNSAIAIWGRRVAAEQVLRQGDRVEILRPLQIDPRDARRELAEAGQVMGGAKDPP